MIPLCLINVLFLFQSSKCFISVYLKEIQVLYAVGWFPACIPLQMLKVKHKACNTCHVTIYREVFPCAFDIAKNINTNFILMFTIDLVISRTTKTT